ncbi:hypothetical protein Ae717Ps2_6838c [Pseudonocardia sp. Ae717_Ps2]|uniref:hypothetical protein n=1 Tax=Pseudonocardia sp. Ae717_Ps2 TaxID=1885573 RepID=UPI00094AEE33|nr:hypothetical protein [Pseudonocardia sp. Ae717_Ps2]OLM28099.1 hypothetical protein Ae717Ps2_6838c [Pseudonocardia sp. Ae717_Ps2]
MSNGTYAVGRAYEAAGPSPRHLDDPGRHCLGVDIEVFFPIEEANRPSPRRARSARGARCGRCASRGQRRREWGVWGGTTREERRANRANRRMPRPAAADPAVAA